MQDNVMYFPMYLCEVFYGNACLYWKRHCGNLPAPNSRDAVSRFLSMCKDLPELPINNDTHIYLVDPESGVLLASGLPWRAQATDSSRLWADVLRGWMWEYDDDVLEGDWLEDDQHDWYTTSSAEAAQIVREEIDRLYFAHPVHQIA